MMFAVGDEIIVLLGDGDGYPAKVKQIAKHKGKMSYFVHYIGWGKRLDAWFPIGQENVILFERTPENEERFVGPLCRQVPKADAGEGSYPRAAPNDASGTAAPVAPAASNGESFVARRSARLANKQ